MKRLLPSLFLFALLCGPLKAQLVITEIMYNTPGEDSLEYIELHNMASATIDLSGYTLSTSATSLTFDNVSLVGGDYLIATRDTSVMQNLFGDGNYFQWTGRNIFNSSDAITIKDMSGQLIDSVRYEDQAPWPREPDGLGASLILCDFSTDNNDPNNWDAATTSANFDLGGTPIFANPEAFSDCSDNPSLSFVGGQQTVQEDDGVLMIGVRIEDGNLNQTQVTVAVRDAESSAEAGSDFVLTTPTLAFQAGVEKDTQFVLLRLLNDMTPETVENLVLELTAPTNDALISPAGDEYELTIIDDEALLTRNLIITGVFDAQPLSGSFGTRGVELFALADIPDLSAFGITSANNGNPGGTVESNLPQQSLAKGSCFYIVQDETKFRDFFGFDPDQVENVTMSINGDDAIELYENGVRIDVFGEVGTDGNGEPWEYLDGWAYRKDGTGPDATEFVLDNWTFSGPNALDLEVTNSGADTPFPLCSYLSPLSDDKPVARNDFANTNINQSVTIDVLDNDFVVNGSPSISISRTANNGTAVVQMDNSISYTPGMDYCGSDDFEYSLCDSLGFCDTATVGITIACPIPLSTIATVRADANGDLVPDSINRTVELHGIVYGENLRTNGLQFTLIDPTGGIAVFIFDFAGYTVQEGDSLRVVGRITQFGGLDQIAPTSIEVISNDNDLEDPVVVTALDESTESAFIRINNLQLVDPSQWDNSLPDNGAGMNIQVTDGTNTYTMRIDNDVDLYNQMAPTEGFDLVGIGGQFDLGTPPDSAYQILPRYEEDLKLRTSTIEQWDLPIKLFPNPATAELFIQAGEEASQIDIYNLLGQPMRSIQEPGLNPRISLEGLAEGMYWLSYQKGRQVKVLKFSIIR